MENTIYIKAMVYMMASFVLGGICGYKYHEYTVGQDIRHILGMNDKSTSKKMNDFLDYKPDTK